MRSLQLMLMALSVLTSLAVASTSSSSPLSTPRGRHRLRQHRHRHDRHNRQRWRLEDNNLRNSASDVPVDNYFEDLRRMSKAYEEMYGRSAATALRQRNEALCDVEMNTVHMNTPTDEFDPPFFVETRCTNVAEFERDRGIFSLRAQTCVHGLLRCVQGYRDLHFSRRRMGSHTWQPFTRQHVPVSCDCMWPAEKYGPQLERDEL